MDKLTQIATLLITFASSIYIMIIMVRFLLQLVRADFYNPLSQFIVKATNPLLMPLRKIIPGFFGVDIASLILALLIQMLASQLISLVSYNSIIPLLPNIIYSIHALLELILNIFFFAFIVLVIVSWVAPHTRSPALDILHSLTEPVLQPLRRILPPMGGLDLSIMIAILIIYILKILLGVN